MRAFIVNFYFCTKRKLYKKFDFLSLIHRLRNYLTSSPMGGSNKYSLVPERPYIPSELEVALAKQVPVATKFDREGRAIPPTGPQPMSARAFQDLHDGSIEDVRRSALMATSGIPQVAPRVHAVMRGNQTDFFEGG